VDGEVAKNKVDYAYQDESYFGNYALSQHMLPSSLINYSSDGKTTLH
jgi:hypothetical protein